MGPTNTLAVVERAAGFRPLVVLSALILLACAPAVQSPARLPLVAPDTMTVVLMGTTDVHGRVYNHDYYTGRATDHGLALLKPLVDSIRGVHGARALLFDSGDLLQGNPLGLVYAKQRGDEPNPIIRAMNLLAYDAAAIGNHEFNYGLAHLARAIELAQFPFLSANIYRAGTTQHAYEPFVLLPVLSAGGDTVTIGVTANTPPGVHVWDRDNVSGILELREIVSSAGDVVRAMRARGADVVIVLSHGGLDGTSYDTVTTGLPAENVSIALAHAVPEIDVIFMGHTHRELADTTINGVLLTQARNWAASLAVATLALERRAPGAWRVTAKRGEIVRPHAARADREFMDSLRWEHERTVTYVNTRIGTAAERLDAREGRVRDTPVIDFINEVQRRVAGADLSSTAAFSIGAALPAGDITIADVAALYPYDNTLKAIRITGAQLRAYLEKSAEYYVTWPPAAGGTVTNFSVPGYNFDIISGADYTLDLSQPVGRRVTSLSYGGAPVRDEQTFTLALNNYRQSGGGGYGMIAGAEVVYDRQEDVRQLLIDEVERRGTITVADWFRENWRIVPAAARDAALREQTARELGAAGAVGAAAAGGRTADSAVGAATAAGGRAAGGAAGGAAAGGTTASERARPRLRVLTTNDFHGNLAPLVTTWSDGRPVGGAAALATYFRMEAEPFPGPTVILDGGDVMQGTPLSNLTRGAAVVDYYNAVGYAGAAVGNHEFDWSAEVLQQRMAQAEFPWLAANILVAGTDTTPSWVRGTAMIERDGVRIGLIGLITEETPTLVMAAHIAGFAFADGAAIIDRHVPALRRQGADFVIVVAHAGVYCEDETLDCAGEMLDWVRRVRHRPDLVVAGHTHRVARTRENGVPIIEAGSWGQWYGVVDLERITADSVDVWIRGTPVAWADRVPADSAMAALVTRTEENVGPRLREVIVTAAEDIPRGAGENPLGRLIADAQRAATGAQVAIMNTGGVRAPVMAGTVTWGDLYRVHPFGNLLVHMRVTGTTLRAALEHGVRGGAPGVHISGAVVDYDPARPAGSRITSIRLTSGEALRDDGGYSVVANDFMTTGGDGFTMFADALEQTPTGIVDLDALIGHIRTLPQPLRAPADVRIRQTSANRETSSTREAGANR